MGRNIVPPRSEVIITGKVIGKGRPKSMSVGVVEPDAINVNGILGANILATVNKRGNIPIRLINITRRPIVLHKNKLIGKFVATIQETVPESNNPSETTQQNLKQKLSDKEFEQLFNWEEISTDEENALLLLLCKYKHIFACNDSDLGLCNWLQHEIHTGNSHSYISLHIIFRMPKEKKWIK